MPVDALRSYQQRYVDNRANDVAAYLAWDPRMGKTRAEVNALLKRAERGMRKALIVGPRKPLIITWPDEIDRTNGRLRHVSLTEGNVASRAEIVQKLPAHPDVPTVLTVNFEVLEQMLPCYDCGHQFRRHVEDRGCGPRDDGTFSCLCLGYHSTARGSRQIIRLSDVIEAWGPEDIIVDEAHLIKSAGADRSLALRRMGRKTLCRRMLSGTPDPQGWLDFYAQFAFLDPTVFGTSKARFLDRYADLNPFTHEIEAWKNTDEIIAKIEPYIIRVRDRDFFGEIGESQIVRSLPWPEKARELYDKLASDHVLTGEITVDGTHKLTRLLRHLQLCGGFIEDLDTGTVHWKNGAKVDAVLGDLEEPLASGQFVVISYQFTPAGVRLTDEIARRYGTDVVALVNGSTPDRDATSILRLFDVHNATPTPLRVLVVQEQVGGVGISLARAQHLFFHSWSMDAAAHEQMRRRVWDPARPAFYTYFQMRDSADVFAREIVKNKLARSVMARGGFDLEAALRGSVQLTSERISA